MAARRKRYVGGDLKAILYLLKEDEGDVIAEETYNDSSSDQSDASDDDENSDPPLQSCARPKLRNLKWVSKLDKPIEKSVFTGQPGINATVNYVNDLLELFELFVTDELVDFIVKETNGYAAKRLAKKFC
jgi:hypothetical protein